MPEPLIKLPKSREEYLVYRLDNNRFNNMVALLRWVYQRANYLNSNEVVFRRMAVWIRNNWSWVVKSYTFEENRLVIEFSVSGIVTSNEWGVDCDSEISEEKELFLFAEGMDVCRPNRS